MGLRKIFFNPNHICFLKILNQFSINRCLVSSHWVTQSLSQICLGNMKNSENSDSEDEQIGFWRKFTFFIRLKMSNFWNAIVYTIAPWKVFLYWKFLSKKLKDLMFWNINQSYNSIKEVKVYWIKQVYFRSGPGNGLILITTLQMTTKSPMQYPRLSLSLEMYTILKCLNLSFLTPF